MRRFFWVLMMLTFLVTAGVRVVRAQDNVLCNTTAVPPFTVTSGKPIIIEWIMPDTAMENGVTVPNRHNGFYLQIDGGPKEDIGMATARPACSGASQKPGDIPYTYTTKTGVSRGNHSLNLSAWSFKLDSEGNPTTNRQESPVITVPFSGGEPLMTGPPMTPMNVAIHQ